MWYCIDCWNARSFESDSRIRMYVICFDFSRCLSSSKTLRHYWLRKFCFESTSLSLRCYALACEENMAATIRVFRVEYELWRSDWLKLLSEWQPGTLYCNYDRNHSSVVLKPFPTLTPWEFPSRFSFATKVCVSWCFEPSQPLGIISGLCHKTLNWLPI